MRKILVLVPIVVTFSCHAQDSARHTRLKLFDINAFAAISAGFQKDLSTTYISSFTNHKEYVSDEFTRGYSDTAVHRFYEWFGPGRFRKEKAAETGINASFKFHTDAKILKRIKPRVGLYYSSQRFFSYEMANYQSKTVDSLHFSDPKYGSIAVDSVYSGYLNYRFTSHQIYAEAGFNFDYIVLRRFIFYTGFVFGYGYAYNNQFLVSKHDDSYLVRRNGTHETLQTFGGTELDKTFNEKETRATRWALPIGVQHRFARYHRFSVSATAEFRFGARNFITPDGTRIVSPLKTWNAGLRFNFDYHK